MAPPSVLSAQERAVLTTICDAFHPPLAAGADDDAALFATNAVEVGVPATAEDAIGRLAPAQQAELRQLLRLLDNTVVALVLSRSTRGVSAMSRAERSRLLSELSTSRIPQLRSGFQALKRLSSFLLYSTRQADGSNPALTAIGYITSPLPPARTASLTVTATAGPMTFDADVCVVGSGAGGGVVAAALAARGFRVIVLEAGPGLQAPDFQQRELEGTQDLYLDSGLTASRDLGVAILAGACLGGGTTVNWQTALRLPDNVRDEWTNRSRCDLFTDSRFSRAMDSVWERLGVSTDESIVNNNNAALQRGCEALGYAWSPIARNSSGCDTTQCGYCTFGCRIGGKQSTAVTYLQDAQQTGDCTIIARCRAQRVTIENGRATGVRAIAQRAGDTDVEIVVRAPRVVVAAGGIESPALLLRSGISLPQLGRNLYLHPTTAIAGLYDERVESWSGPPQTIVCNQFANLHGGYGFRLETAPAHPGLLALALPWTSPVQHRRLMQRVPHAGAIIALCRDAAGGRVTVRHDGTSIVDYVPGRAEQQLVAQGTAAAARVHLAAGATEVHTLQTRPMSIRRTTATTQHDIDSFCDRVLDARVGRNWSLVASAHQMGTCRMGSDKQSAVCDERGEVFGVAGLHVADASAFPASSGVNPMITVMALAACVADGIAR
jgi:choline dehydrogenase-like flavoprotein